MNKLDEVTRSLQVVLAASRTTNDCPWVASWEDAAGSGQPAQDKSGAGITDGTTAVTIVAAPTATAGGTRKLTSFGLSNADTAPITVSILYKDDANSYVIVGPMVLQPGESIAYTEQAGWYALDNNAAIKTANDTGGISEAQSTAVSAGIAASTASSVASTALSAAAVASAAASTALQDATAWSTNGSGIVSQNFSIYTSASVRQSGTESTQASAGWSVTISKTKSSFGF